METIIEIVREVWSTIHSGTWPELGVWSYVLLAILVATEGPVSTLLGAAAAAAGILDIRLVFLAAFLGNVIGDCLWYSIGYANNLQSIYRRGRWLGLQRHHLDRLELEMHTHATKLIALSKLAIGLIIPTLVAAGLARVPWKRWFPLVFAIEIAWTLLMVNLGYHSAELITRFEHSIQIIGVVVLVTLMGAVIWYAQRTYRQSEKALVSEQTAIQPLALPLVQREQTREQKLPVAITGRTSSRTVAPHASSSSSHKSSTKQKSRKVHLAFEEAL